MTNLLKPKFPVMLRKMWSGKEVQDWLDAQDLVPREAYRKQVLKEVVDGLPLKTVGIYDSDYQTGTKDGWNDAVDELRRMAEGEK
jgi:hypothetical protein